MIYDYLLLSPLWPLDVSFSNRAHALTWWDTPDETRSSLRTLKSLGKTEAESLLITCEKKLKITLAEILGSGIFILTFFVRLVLDGKTRCLAAVWVVKC